MTSRNENPRKERDDTDASLLAERAKTDAELASKGSVLQKEEDHIVALARKRAEDAVGAARQRADREMAATGAAPELKEEVATERAAVDGAVAEQRIADDEHLRAEREKHKTALFALLRLEREATDDGLLVERAHADEVVTTRDDFLGMVSHDLRNILGTMAMSAGLLVKYGSGADPQTKGHAERIQRGAARMNRLVGDLLDVVSLEAGKLHVLPVSQDATKVARDAVDAFEPSFSDKGISLTGNLPVGAIVAKFDHDRILQVLANLLGNALKFTERGGHVALELEADGPSVRFSVTDTGIGIPADHSEAIFERFGQVTRDRRGHGLGLYIAKCIVEAHDGKIWAERPDVGGTALRFTLPGTVVT